jgi:hypothetical protein
MPLSMAPSPIPRRSTAHWYSRRRLGSRDWRDGWGCEELGHGDWEEVSHMVCEELGRRDGISSPEGHEELGHGKEGSRNPPHRHRLRPPCTPLSRPLQSSSDLSLYPTTSPASLCQVRNNSTYICRSVQSLAPPTHNNSTEDTCYVHVHQAWCLHRTEIVPKKRCW